MPEFFLELFSEEIPARMQAARRRPWHALSARAWPHCRRRISAPFTARAASRLPRVSRPRLRRYARRTRAASHRARAGADRLPAQARRRRGTASGRGRLLGAGQGGALGSRRGTDRRRVPALLRRFPWPKSMRWGGTSAFTWVRPLRRIVCLLDGAVVPFDLRDGADDGHGLAIVRPDRGPSLPRARRRRRAVLRRLGGETARAPRLVDAAERKRVIAEGVAHLAAERQLTVVDDPGLLDEVAGLVEWPVPLLGRIDDAFMDLPPEVMQVSMRVNQRYFALRTPTAAGPYGSPSSPTSPARRRRRPSSPATSACCAPASPTRGISGTSTARRGWRAGCRARPRDVPRQTGQPGRAGPPPDGWPSISPHWCTPARPGRARGGTLQGRPGHRHGRRVPRTAGRHGPLLRAARRRGPGRRRRHPRPLRAAGPTDAVPTAPVSIAVALADKLDQLAGFFAIGESRPARATPTRCAAPASASSASSARTGCG
jgi:glycyl-tRNA synthetase beta chain